MSIFRMIVAAGLALTAGVLVETAKAPQAGPAAVSLASTAG